MEDAAAGKRQTLVILNPGHFHAALTLRERHSLIDDDIHVFAEDGPDVENFVRLVQAFNERPVNPTQWRLHVHRGIDYLEKLLAERPGKAVIVAGRNSKKMPLIHQLHAEGFSVLADKPWLIDSRQVGLLGEITADAPLAMDIMTERHEVTNRLLKAFMRRPEIFGNFRIGDGRPTIAFRSVHHLYKMVNGQPLRRPSWYFEPDIQGGGITDVTTHLIDLVQWMIGDGVLFDFARDIDGLSARQWSTSVSHDIFSRITGLEDFPETLRDKVVDGSLQYPCNATLSYRLRGIPVQIEAVWELEEPMGGSDFHHAILRGSRADLVVEQGVETKFLTTLAVVPVDAGDGYADSLATAVAEMQGEFPGLGLRFAGKGFQVTIPKALRTTHEQHFAAVLKTFLEYLDKDAWPENVGPDLVSKYTLMAQALESTRLP